MALVISLSILASQCASLGDVGETVWQKAFGGDGYDEAWSVQQTSDGGYIVAGFTGSSGAGAHDVYVLKLDASGNKVWEKAFGGSNTDEAYNVCQTGDGGLIVAGCTCSSGAGRCDIYILRLDSDGNRTWEQIFGGRNDDLAYCVRQTRDGGYVVVGFTASSGAGWEDVYILKLDGTGDKAWEKTFGGSSPDKGYCIQETNEGGYIVAGWTQSFGVVQAEVYVLKLDADGNLEWQKTFGGSSWDGAYSIQQTNDGGYIVAGCTYSSGSGNGDVYVLKLDASGNKVWEKAFGGKGYDVAWHVRQTSDGGYIVGGYTNSFGSGAHDVYVLKLNASGNKVWEKTFGGILDDGAYSIEQTQDGGYIIAGYTCSFGTGWEDVYIIKTDAEGNTGPYPN